ncbi:rRNA maturation RNase YbeY [Corynebacterium massiliense]|uniref:Endoribonuclease YbeY n=1 Tax=Corynebacterium massiliense DSM 45435 TaxID=1121364 RepID=A0ABY7U9M3_9CORY|nr:rRNA maturation RNase YbeY [Corynebacterium massiliense]WCZ32958.1 Endoribonuclease YbeY [Corynebacterium massiliense DSM 45435]
MSIEFLNECPVDGINEEMLIDVASFVLGAMDVNPDAEASITCVDLRTIEDLHVRWMDLEGPTDVMSFPLDDAAMLGDIVLCPEFAEKQARAAGHSLAHELALLTTHGCLHLLGYDHATPAEEKEMFALQNELLADWYDHVRDSGLDFPPKPTGPEAFPSAAQRENLDKRLD